MAIKVQPVRSNPDNSPSGASLLGRFVGAVGGFVVGGPGGAMKGQEFGGKAGEAIGGDGPQAPMTSQNVEAPESAISRRLAANESSGRLAQLRDSAMALPELPDELRQQYAAPILQAYSAEVQSRKKGGV